MERPSVFVHRTAEWEALARAIEARGIALVREQHGSGPEHFSFPAGDGVLVELYPDDGKPRRCERYEPVARAYVHVCRACFDGFVRSRLPRPTSALGFLDDALAVLAMPVHVKVTVDERVADGVTTRGLREGLWHFTGPDGTFAITYVDGRPTDAPAFFEERAWPSGDGGEYAASVADVTAVLERVTSREDLPRIANELARERGTIAIVRALTILTGLDLLGARRLLG